MALKICQLKKSFSGKLLFEHVDYTFPPHGLVILLGRSGAGKTTLFYTIFGLESLDEGKIIMDDKELKSAEDFQKFRKECGFVFQEYGVLNYLTANENLMLGGNKPAEISFLKKDLMDKKTGNLSGGEKQRLSLARELAKKPKILFCDEPTGSLDEKIGKDIMEILKREAQNCLVFMVSHNLKLAHEYADIILELKDQKLQVLEDHLVRKNVAEKCAKIKNNLYNEIKVVFSSFVHEKVKIVFTFLAFLLAFSSLLLMNSLNTSAPKAIAYETETIADCTRLKVTEMEKNPIEGTSFSLSKMHRPSLDLLKDEVGSFAYIEPNMDHFLQSAVIKIDNIEKSIFLKSFPYGSTLEDIRANSQAKELLHKGSEVDILIHQEIESTFSSKSVKDSLSLEIKGTINYIYDEFDFLNYPILYISSDALKEYMVGVTLSKASSLLGYQLTLYDRYDTFGEEDDPLKSYSYYVDIKERKNISLVREKISSIPLDEGHSYDIESRYITIQDTLFSSMQLIEMIMKIFSFLSMIISVCLLYLFLISNFQSRKKEFALYKTMGIAKKRLYLYCFIPLLIYTFIAFFFSFIPWKVGSMILGDLLLPYFGLNIFSYASFSIEEIGGLMFLLFILSLGLAFFPWNQAKKLKVSEVIRSE